MADDPTRDDAPPGDRTHPDRASLRAHLDGTLPDSQERSVAAHVDGCARCLEVLEELEPPVDLRAGTRADGAAPPAWDDRRMRRAVRRTLLRIAVNAVVLLVMGTIGLSLFAWLVWHPLAIDRGERIAEHVEAAVDLPVLTIPGAEVQGFNSNVGLLRRLTEVDVERAVGATMVDLGSYEARLGPFGASGDVGRFGAFLEGGRTTGEFVSGAFDPDRLGPGTAVTVELIWDTPVGLADADATAAATDDVALLWVGFEVPGAEDAQDPDVRDPWERLGYSACQAIPDDLGVTGFGGGGFGRGGLRIWSPSADTGAGHALAQVRRATANLVTSELIEDGRGPLRDLPATAAWYADNEPGVRSVVVTGSTEEVAEVRSASGADEAVLLDVDFDRGPPQPCG